MPEDARKSTSTPGDEAVPRLPRGRGLKLSGPTLWRIVFTLALLVFLIVSQRPCADSVSRFVTNFDDQGSAASANPSSRPLPRPGTIDLPGSAAIPMDESQYEVLRPGMTEAEIKAAVERARARAAGQGRATTAPGAGSAGTR